MRKAILLFTIACVAALGSQAQQSSGNSNTAGSANHAQDQKNQNNGTSDSNSPSNAGPREMAARHGLDMLDQTNKARTAIGNKNKQEALNDIGIAIKDLQKARSERQGKVIPLYQEFASVSVVAPVRAEQTAESSSSNASSSGKSPASVHQVHGSYSVMELNTEGTISQLNAAKAALKNDDWKTADKDLAAVQDGVVFASYQSDLPLVRAQENLILARQNARKGNFQEVHAALASSAKALAAYEVQGGSHVDDAKNLQHQISSYNQHIDQDHKDAIKKIDGWWNTASNWLQNPSSSS
jgi:YfdX protein